MKMIIKLRKFVMYKHQKELIFFKWLQDYLKALRLLVKIRHHNRKIQYTYPLPGKILFKTLSILSRKEILRLGKNLTLNWSEIQSLLIFTNHEELHLRCKADYIFIKKHMN